MSKQSIDLNVDLAEGFAFDDALLQQTTSANIACGIHAGDYQTIYQALLSAKKYGTRLGAHPSFPDRENFGRKPMQLPADALRASLFYQLGALAAMVKAEGLTLSYVKPHGALYNQAAKDEALATQIVEVIKAFDPSLALMGLSGSLMLQVAKAHGLTTISEVFADRRYQDDGSLVPRSESDATLSSDEEAVTQVLQMVNGSVTSRSGKVIAIEADSICLHGDNEHALDFAKKIRKALTDNGIALKA